MKDYSWQTVESIIDEVLELPKEKREAYIRERCKNNPELKDEVTLLLTSITESEGWLEHPESYKSELFNELSTDIESISAGGTLIGVQIGSYVIREEIGKGGMGSVFRAERTEDDITHQVAIKILDEARASTSIIERFKREQQVLAKLNHPNIARFYDGGITQGGAPYIIMEYIDGIPIDEYCRKQGCSIQQKRQFFKDILNGVRYAHENLVIHRDLKPGNILVTENGDVKILDFGISKLIDDDVDLNLTREGSRLLTPKYASPEQILEQNITTATDTYSLGILFYYLLTDTFPFDLDNLTHYEAEQEILKSSPKKPSESVSDPSLKKKLSGDLDAIILKAIRKEADYRYHTANEFLDEFENLERNLPVSAHDDSSYYRFRKFIKRNKKNVSFASILIVVMISLASLFTWQVMEERNQANIEARKAASVKNLLIDIFEANDPILNEEDEGASLPALLEAGTNKIMTQNADPSVKIELLLALSTIYQNITNFDKARELATKSLELSTQHFGPVSKNVAKSHIQLAGIDIDLGNFEEGKRDLLKAKNILSEPVSSDPVYAKLYEHLGLAEESLSNFDSSRTYFKKSLALLKQQATVDSADYVSVLRSVARGYHRESKHQKGDSLMLMALEVSEKFHGRDDIVTASVLGDLGLYLMTRAEYEEARDYYTRSLDIKEKVYGDDGHPNYTATLTNLGVLEETLGNFRVAESIFTKTIEIDKRLFGEEHPYVAMSKSHLGGINFSLGNYGEAKKMYAETMEVYKNSYGSDHYYMAGVYKGYARALSVLGEEEIATEYFKKALKIYENNDVADEAIFAKLYEAMGNHFQRSENHPMAITYYNQCADLFAPLFYDEYKIRSAKCQLNLAKSHLALKQSNKAEVVLQNLRQKADSTQAIANNQEIMQLLEETKQSL